MKVFFATVVVIGFMAMALFGMAGMDHPAGHQDDCIAAMAQGINCAGLTASGLLELHQQFYQSFSTATLLPLLAGLLLATVLILFERSRVRMTPVLPLVRRWHEKRESRIVRPKLFRWLVRLQLSPPVP